MTTKHTPEQMKQEKERRALDIKIQMEARKRLFKQRRPRHD